MEKRILATALGIIFISSAAVSQHITPQKLVPGTWVKNWLLRGPVPLTQQ